jgi:hypothetical protein
MKRLHIQVQPERSPDLDEVVVAALLGAVGSGTTLVSRVAISEGHDDGRIIDIAYQTSDLAGLWSLIRKQVLDDPVVGPRLARCMIAVCQGDAGWDDYLLLHHFDADQPIDSFPSDESNQRGQSP